jgi:hypothetical protein
VTRIDWAANTQPTPDGHLLWTGPRGGRKGELRISRSDHRSPRRYAYTQHHGRDPQGSVLADCGQRLCVQGAHLADYIDRQTRGALAAWAAGMDLWAGECTNGHAWAETARFRRDGRRWCSECTRTVAGDVDEIAVEAAMSGRAVRLTRAERMEVVRVLTLAGRPAWFIAERAGVTARTVHRWRGEHGWKAAA